MQRPSCFHFLKLEVFFWSHLFFGRRFLDSNELHDCSVVCLVNLSVFSLLLDELHFSSFIHFTVASYSWCWDKLHCLWQVSTLYVCVPNTKPSCHKVYYNLWFMFTENKVSSSKKAQLKYSFIQSCISSEADPTLEDDFIDIWSNSFLPTIMEVFLIWGAILSAQLIL